MNVQSLDYRELQKTCKENKLKATGDKSELQNRLIEFFKLNKSVNNLSNELSKLNIENNEIEYKYVNPTTTTYKVTEAKCIIDLAIEVSDSLKKDVERFSIRQMFNQYIQKVTSCSVKEERKIIFILAIITLFKEEILDGQSKGKNRNIVCDELISYGKKTYETLKKKNKNI